MYLQLSLSCNIQLHSLRGVQGPKVWEHDFEITSDPKGPERTRKWSGFEALGAYSNSNLHKRFTHFCMFFCFTNNSVNLIYFYLIFSHFVVYGSNYMCQKNKFLCWIFMDIWLFLHLVSIPLCIHDIIKLSSACFININF